MEQKEIYIKYVANYMRKSRGESEADLIKQKTELFELCEKNGWKHIEYEEIESGDSIALRPIFQRLLNDIENDTFDAVAVVDIDRLGRGDLGDQDKIKKTLVKSSTLVVTPNAIYNLENENDEFSVDMKSFFARQEYKTIVRRLTRGKRMGAKLGQWTNGKPPFPYEYERWRDPLTGKEDYNEKGLVINEEKLHIYRRIIESVTLHRKTTNQIAWELNKESIPSPKNKEWRGEVIRRMLLDETHLGYIISNKTQGDGHRNKKPSSKEPKVIPREQWTIIPDCHEAVKTQEEHDLITMFLGRITKAPRIVRKKAHPLADLVKCGVCGHTMQVASREDRKTPDSIKPCWYRNGIGEKCNCSGGPANIVYDVILDNIEQYENEVIKRIEERKGSKTEYIEKEFKILKKRIAEQERISTVVYDKYEKGIYDDNEFKTRREKVKNEIGMLQEEHKVLEIKLKHLKNMSDEERLDKLQLFQNALKGDLTPLERNELYKSIIDSIIWTRKEPKGKVIIKINFL